jgi:hypothetical protein
MLSSGSFASGVVGSGLAAHVAIQVFRGAFRGAPATWGISKRKQTTPQLRSSLITWRSPLAELDFGKIAFRAFWRYFIAE